MTALHPSQLAATRTAGRPHRPALAAGAALGVCVLVNLVDPNQQGSLGTCPFKLVTGGLDCPGCGTLRATRALTRGDLGLALDHNLLFVALVPLLLWGLVGWARHELGRRAVLPRIATPLALTIAAAVPAWWLLRNLPWFAWFASGAA